MDQLQNYMRNYTIMHRVTRDAGSPVLPVYGAVVNFVRQGDLIANAQEGEKPWMEIATGPEFPLRPLPVDAMEEEEPESEREELTEEQRQQNYTKSIRQFNKRKAEINWEDCNDADTNEVHL